MSALLSIVCCGLTGGWGFQCDMAGKLVLAFGSSVFPS